MIHLYIGNQYIRELTRPTSTCQPDRIEVGGRVVVHITKQDDAEIFEADYGKGLLPISFKDNPHKAEMRPFMNKLEVGNEFANHGFRIIKEDDASFTLEYLGTPKLA